MTAMTGNIAMNRIFARQLKNNAVIWKSGIRRQNPARALKVQDFASLRTSVFQKIIAVQYQTALSGGIFARKQNMQQEYA